MGRRSSPTLLALGDSIISDCYPGKNHGAAAVAHRELGGGLELVNLSRTGDRLREVERKIPREALDVRYLLLSVGGNDLLGGELDQASFERSYRQLLERLQQLYPKARRAVLNLYDPTDGTGRVASDIERGKPGRPELVECVAWLNRVVAAAAGPDLVDIHSHFFGHGVSAALADSWYFHDIEPNRRGASEVGRLVVEHLRVGVPR